MIWKQVQRWLKKKKHQFESCLLSLGLLRVYVTAFALKSLKPALKYFSLIIDFTFWIRFLSIFFISTATCCCLKSHFSCVSMAAHYFSIWGLSKIFRKTYVFILGLECFASSSVYEIWICSSVLLADLSSKCCVGAWYSDRSSSYQGKKSGGLY